MKIFPQPFVIKHYKDGDYNKDYDRQIVETSILNFMKDPTGDLPWEEDPTGADVLHIKDAKVYKYFTFCNLFENFIIFLFYRFLPNF